MNLRFVNPTLKPTSNASDVDYLQLFKFYAFYVNEAVYNEKPIAMKKRGKSLNIKLYEREENEATNAGFKPAILNWYGPYGFYDAENDGRNATWSPGQPILLHINVESSTNEEDF
ncbi:hypothetical protein N7454_007776 [Penicillium verhagenii]|nr:hypothetical protein N7454_007776 [Penicillium verhagenii]